MSMGPRSDPDAFERQLRAALRPTPAPADLQEALLRGRRPVAGWRRWSGLAALLCLALLGGVVFIRQHSGGGRQGARLLQAALQHRLEPAGLEFIPVAAGDGSNSPQCQCRTWSQQALGFPAELPALLSEQDLKGGRACSMAGERAACYILLDGRTLYVLPRPIPGLGHGPVARAGDLEARAWNEGERGYILVGPPGT